MNGAKRTRIVICGAAGRMGRRLVALAREDAALQVAGAVEHAGHATLGEDVGVVAGVGSLGVTITSDLAAALPGANVVIAFVNEPAASMEQAQLCARAGIALVVGTTGLSADQEKDFRREAAAIPVVKASNFSVGVAVLVHLIEEAAALLGPSFDCEIIEAHHTRKKDAPSGTALSLAQAAARARGWKLDEVARHGREGIVGERPAKEIGLHAVRAGDIVGQHTVLFGGTGETVELVHRAQSRDTFAMGALRAAKWVIGRPPGVYDMRDVLDLP